MFEMQNATQTWLATPPPHNPAFTIAGLPVKTHDTCIPTTISAHAPCQDLGISSVAPAE
jgi:hypothetical protein